MASARTGNAPRDAPIWLFLHPDAQRPRRRRRLLRRRRLRASASVPRLYNVVEVKRDLSRVRVHTCRLRKPTGGVGGLGGVAGAAERESGGRTAEIALGRDQGP